MWNFFVLELAIFILNFNSVNRAQVFFFLSSKLLSFKMTTAHYPTGVPNQSPPGGHLGLSP